MIRFVTVMLLVLLIQPAPLRLEASTARSEFVRGDLLTISAYLFNDSAGPIGGTIAIASPPGFVALGVEGVSGAIPPDRALHLDARYQIATNAPKGRSRFVVTSGGLMREVWIRVGPIEARPPWQRVWLGMVRK